MKCTVGSCKEDSRKRSSGIHYYRFPSKPEQLKFWIDFCEKSRPITKHDRICSMHFKSEDFERNFKFEMGLTENNIPKLKPDAIPSVKKPSQKENFLQFNEDGNIMEHRDESANINNNPLYLQIRDSEWQVNKTIMEMERKIEDLEKYIPFIDYLLSLDREKHQKLEKIKEWIIGKKRFASDVVKTIEQSVFTQYRNHLLEDVKMPKEILKVFSKTEGVKYSMVNLCSDDDDESDDDVICISPTPESNKSKKHDSKYKDEKACTSSSILLDTKSIEKSETKESARVTSSTDLHENAQSEARKVNYSDMSDGEIVDSDSENVIRKRREKKKAAKQVEKRLSSLSKSPEKTKSNTDKIAKHKTDEERKLKKERKKHKKKRKKSAHNETPEVIVLNESPNKNKEVSSTSSIAVDADDDAAFFERIEKVCILSDQANDNTDTESLCSDLDFLTTLINENKPKDNPTDVDIKKEELFTRRQKTVEKSCTVESQHDSLRQNDNVDTVVYSLSESEEDMGSIVSEYNDESNKPGTPKINDEKVEGAAVQLENKLEMLDINELDTILKKLTSKNDFDLEQCLMQLVAQTQTENYAHQIALQKASAMNCHNNTKVTKKLPPQISLISNSSSNESSRSPLPAESCIPLLPKSSPYESFIPQLPNCSPHESFTPQPSNGTPNESFMHPLSNCSPHESFTPPSNYSTSPRENFNQSATTSSTFQTQTQRQQQAPIVQQAPYQANISKFQLNGRKLNLNDPRIVRQLQILQNSPINSSIREMATNLTNYTKTVQHTKPKDSPKPPTYGEYKRRKAALRAEAERKEAEHKKEVERRQEVEQRKKAEKKREAERLAEERQAAERLAEEQRAAERVAEVKRTAERFAEERRAAERLAEEIRAAERLAEEQRAAERLAEEKRVAELLAEEQRAAERLAEEKRAAERLAEEKRVAERLAEEKRVAERIAEEKRAADQTDRIRQILRDNPKSTIESIINAQTEVHKKVDNKMENKILNSTITTDSSSPLAVASSEKNISSIPKTLKKVGRKPGVRKICYKYLPEALPAAPISNNNSEPSKLPKKVQKKTEDSKILRTLKSLECTFIGFNDFKDYIPTSLNGKRLSSESARNAISKQLNVRATAAQYDDSTDDDLSNKKPVVVNNEPPKRRSSFTIEHKEPSFTAAPITGRRKTCVEFDEDSSSRAPILNRRKTCTASFGVARSSSPIVHDHLICLSDSSQPPTENATVVDISSSSDTDAFDLVVFKREKELRAEERRKLEEQKKLIINNQPVVRLLRHTKEGINKLLNHTKRKVNYNPLPIKEEVLNVQLVQAASYDKTMQPESTAKKSTKPTTNQVKNVLSNMTERNTRYCVLCKSKPSDLVNHYVRTHKCEPYVARLSEDELRDLQINWPSAIPCASNAENPRVLKYEVKCLFCEDNLIDSFINFYNHFASHTGEYGFQCENCKLQKPFRADIQSHKHHSKSCRNARIQTMYQYPPNLMAIYLHCCKLCNFVQLNEANVHKHLRDHHDQPSSYNSNLVQKYIAAAINDAEIVNEASQESESLEDVEIEGIPADMQNMSEFKREFILDELANLNASEKKIAPSVATRTKIATTPVTVIHNENNIDDTIATAEEIPRPIVVKTEPVVKNEIDIELGEVGAETQNFSQTLQTKLLKRNQPQLWYRLYTPDTPYFGLFKCRATDCLFSTNESVEMLNHLYDHSTSECPPSGYLDCSYCMLQPNQCPTPGALIQHVLDMHYYSCFQCSKCGYRSCIPGNTVIHRRTAHFMDDEDVECDVVYACDGAIATVNERFADMMHSMEQNVSKLQCNYCHQGFYALSNLKKHLMQQHKAIEEAFDEYVCIYCGRNAADKKEMQSHLALKHPDELAYTCLRVLQDVQKGDAVSNLTLCDIKEDVLPINIRQTGVNASEILATDTNVILSNQDTAADFSFHSDEEIHEILEEPQDMKPSFEQLEQIAVDSLGSLLNKLTAKTGLPPDILYQCAETTCGGFFSNHELWSRHMKLRHNCSIASCPHCPDRKEFAVADFSQHFEEHCRHLYVCFHCGMTFVNVVGIVRHFRLEHSTTANTTDIRFETIKFNIRYSYHILINAQFCTERLEFLEALRVNVIKRLDQLATEQKSKLPNKWIVPLTAEWLDSFPMYSRTSHCMKKCLDKKCTFKTACDSELATHLKTRHTINSMRFQCSKCSFYISKCNNWDQILDHFAMHKSNIFACCVCGFYHFQRANLMAHIKTEHNSRDVPFISLDRSVEGTNVSIGVVFVAGRKILSTTRQCFFCTSADIFTQTYIKHLKNAHNVHLKYHCELCLEQFENLVDVDEHFQSAHMGLQIKISCEFISDDQVEVCQIRPLKLNVVNAIASAIAAKRAFENDDTTTLCSDNKRLRISYPKIGDIKKELLDDDDNNTDSSVEIVEDDDIVCASELKNCRNESNVTAAPKIKLKSLSELFNNDSPASPSNQQSDIAAAASPAIQTKYVSQLLPNISTNVAVEPSGTQIKNISQFLSNDSLILPPNIADAAPGTQFDLSELLSSNSFTASPSIQQSNVAAGSSGIQIVNVSTLNKNLPTSANRDEISLRSLLTGSVVMTTTASTTHSAFTTTATASTAGAAASTTPFAPKRFRQLAPKDVPAQPIKIPSYLNLPKSCNVTPKYVTAQPNHSAPKIVKIAPFHVVPSTYQIDHQYNITTKQIAPKIVSISSNRPIAPKKVNILNGQLKISTPPTSQVNYQISDVTTNSNSMLLEPSSQTTKTTQQQQQQLQASSSDLNCVQLPKNLTIRPIPAGTKITGITWISPPPRQPK